jgi:hypothetical protein
MTLLQRLEEYAGGMSDGFDDDDMTQYRTQLAEDACMFFIVFLDEGCFDL